MPKYNKVTPELIQKLLDLLGKHNMTTDPEKLDVYKTDEETNPAYFHTGLFPYAGSRCFPGNDGTSSCYYETGQ